MLPLASLTDPSTILLAVVAITAVMLLMRSSRYFARQRREETAPTLHTPRPTPHGAGSARPSPARRAGMEGAPEEAARWQVEMHNTAREFLGQIETKMRALQALIAEADRAAARLEAALNSSGEAPRPSANFAADNRVGWDQRSAVPPETGHVATDADGPAAPAPTDRAGRREEICTLADYGYDAAEIARRTGSPVGEVELILSLRGQRDLGI
jgi:hypothetical protein